MANRQASVLRQFGTLLEVGTLGGLSDGQLLGRFLSGQEGIAEAAFAALVDRHGPMVMSVCRNILRDFHGAQDAFQATFLVLARKAGTIVAKESLGNWLYGVAYRTASKARTGAARRHRHERRCVEMTREGYTPDPDGHELRAMLHEEIRRLPEKYRAPVVLCHLEGKSRDAAAKLLGCPVSTIGVRLMRARERLRGRLTGRGIALTAGLLTSGLRPGSASAAVSVALAEATARIAMRGAADGAMVVGADTASVVALADGVLKTMFLKKLKIAAMAIALVASSASLFALREAGAQLQPSRTDGGGERGASAPARIQAGEGQEQPKKKDSEVDEELTRSISGRIVRAEPIGKDCMVLAYLPDWSHGDVDNLAVANNDGGVRTLLDWPEATRPEADAPGRRYLVALYSRTTTSPEPTGPILAFRILEEWPEKTSWKTQPSYSLEPDATFKFAPGAGWKLFDVTPLIRARSKARERGHGLLLRFLSEDRTGQRQNWSGHQFVSREGSGEWSHRRPMLLTVEPEK